MSSQVIQDAAVEAAAKSLADIADPLGEWDNQAAPYRNWYKRQAEAVLAAAAPHIGARAHEVPIDLTRATVAMASVDDGSAGWTTPGRGPVESHAFIQRMLEKTWDEGYATGVRGERPGWTKNPYRPTA